ncbi:MAG: threonine--tRNA ligase, partial [Pseudomonadota bacterium]|nr:threonine--tRNA ligase [Pseudomonadota bacterium]
LALRPELRAGGDDVWDRAEDGLRAALKAANLDWEELPGEGAFYGPKIEYHLRDAIGRTWQCGTLQLDFVLPERLDASYVGEDGNKHRPVMLHRAVLGTLERFIGIMLESYAGKLPLWLAPDQIMVCPITTEADSYGVTVMEALKEVGLRVGIDLRNEKINYKVREHSVSKIPVILAVGGREADGRTVSMRRLGSKESQILSLDEAVQMLAAEATPPDLRV